MIQICMIWIHMICRFFPILKIDTSVVSPFIIKVRKHAKLNSWGTFWCMHAHYIVLVLSKEREREREMAFVASPFLYHFKPPADLTILAFHHGSHIIYFPLRKLYVVKTTLSWHRYKYEKTCYSRLLFLNGHYI